MMNIHVPTASMLVTISLGLGWCAEKPPQPPPHGPSAYRDQVLADRPAGYWRLDEASGTVAFGQIGKANHGAIEKGVSLKYPGATADGDTAMFFDARRGQITVPTAPALEMGNGSITLEAWVKFVGLQAGEVTILGKGTAGVQTEYGLVLVDGVPGYQSVVERYLSTWSGLAPGVWTHLAVTISNNTVGTFYVNGAVAGTFSANTGHLVTRSTQPVMIGNEAGASARFVGGIDEPAIYSYPLTAQQLTRHVTLAAQTSH